MMGEPMTLGRRVRAAIDDYPSWPSEDYPMRLAKLCALVDYADAVERLAKAACEIDWIDGELEDYDPDEYVALSEARAVAEVDLDAALAAYREAVANG